MRARCLQPEPIPHKVENRDVFELSCDSADVVYLDPPYTKRQYAAYYHLVETVAIGDQPVVGGVTGLRPWSTKSSPFCFKRKALTSLIRLVNGFESRRLLISYNSEGHIPLADLRVALRRLGQVRSVALSKVARYTPNDKARENGEVVTEHLLELVRQ